MRARREYRGGEAGGRLRHAGGICTRQMCLMDMDPGPSTLGLCLVHDLELVITVGDEQHAPVAIERVLDDNGYRVQPVVCRYI
jgi:hypothetical protein